MKQVSLTPEAEMSMINNLVLVVVSLNKNSFDKINKLKEIALRDYDSSIEYQQTVNRMIELSRQASKSKNYTATLLALANTDCWADKAIRANI